MQTIDVISTNSDVGLGQNFDNLVNKTLLLLDSILSEEVLSSKPRIRNPRFQPIRNEQHMPGKVYEHEIEKRLNKVVEG